MEQNAATTTKCYPACLLSRAPEAFRDQDFLRTVLATVSPLTPKSNSKVLLYTDPISGASLWGNLNILNLSTKVVIHMNQMNPNVFYI